MGRTGNGPAYFFSKAGNSLDYILALIETILYLEAYFVLNLDGVVESPIYCVAAVFYSAAF